MSRYAVRMTRWRLKKVGLRRNKKLVPETAEWSKLKML
jgi:hypothetical protein